MSGQLPGFGMAARVVFMVIGFVSTGWEMADFLSGATSEAKKMLPFSSEAPAKKQHSDNGDEVTARYMWNQPESDRGR